MVGLTRKAIAWLSLTAVLTVLLCPLTAVSAVMSQQAEIYSDAIYEEQLRSTLNLSSEAYQKLKQEIASAIRNHTEKLDVSEFGIMYGEDVRAVLNDLIFDTGEYFNVQDTTYWYNDVPERPLFTTIEFHYNCTKTEYQKMLAECETAATQLLDGLDDPSLDDIEKALLLHDRLAVWCEYDMRYYEGTNPPESYTMYGALALGLAVCQGYSEAYGYLLDQVGIDSYLCYSDQINHTWNIVYINGLKYHVDVTWDDPTYDVTGLVLHDYFLISSNTLYQGNHNADDTDHTPHDTTFEGWFWKDSETEFQLLNGKIYYVDNTAQTLNQWDDEELDVLYNIESEWPSGEGYHWLNNYTRLSSDGEYLYYSVADGVWVYDVETGNTSMVFAPDLTEFPPYFSIFGFKEDNGWLYYELFNTQMFESDTKELYQRSVQYRIVKVLLGDINSDDSINAIDATRVLLTTVGRIALDDGGQLAADVNKDGNINAMDATLILLHAVGKRPLEN